MPSFKALVTFRCPELRSLLGLSSNRSSDRHREAYSLSDPRAAPSSSSQSCRRSHGGADQFGPISTKQEEVDMTAMNNEYGAHAQGTS